MSALGQAGIVVLKALILLIALYFVFWKLWFSRQPRRNVPSDPGLITSPANGTVAVVRRFDTMWGNSSVKAEKWNAGSVEFLASDVAAKGWFVLIVMTPMDVHWQRAPVAGKVVATRHTSGRFRNAVKEPEKLLTLENEKNEILIDAGKDGKGRGRRVKVVQIAGVLARRIRCFVRREGKIEKGAVIGFIDLGSQVALLLPEAVELKVKAGDKVKDGETVIGAWR